MTAVRESWWRRWLRARLGPPPLSGPALVARGSTVSGAPVGTPASEGGRVALAIAAASLAAHLVAAQRRHAHVAYQLVALRDVEPGPTERCRKIRLRDQVDADQMIARLSADTGRRRDEFRTYRCGVCPRNPITTGKYLHVANIDPAERTGRGGASRADGNRRTVGRAGSEGRLVSQRLAPDVVARLRTITARTEEVS